MSEIVDKALALMLRHAANEASDYGDVRPATGFGPAVSSERRLTTRCRASHLRSCRLFAGGSDITSPQ